MSVLACDLTAMSAEQRKIYQSASRELWAKLEELVELSSGFGFRFPVDIFLQVAQFVSLERLCCPFLSFDLQLENQPSFWLRISGPEGVKDFLKTELRI